MGYVVLRSLNSINNKKISEYAFFEMKNLRTVDIAEGVVEIGKNAFCLNKLTDITIPSTVTYIDNEGIIAKNYDWCEQLDRMGKKNDGPLNCHVVRNSFGADYAIQWPREKFFVKAVFHDKTTM